MTPNKNQRLNLGNFEAPFTPRTRLGIPPNFAKTRFGRFPTFHFSTSNFFSKLRTAVYPPRMAPFCLKLWENAFQAIPDISFFDVEKCFRNFERPFTPQTWLQSARNFAKTRFGRFWIFRLLTPKIVFGENFGSKFSFFANLAWFWAIHGRTDVKISFHVKFCSR